MRQFVFWVFLLLIAAAMGGSIAYAARPWFDAAKVLQLETGQELPSPVRPTFTPVASPTHLASVPLPSPTPTRPPIISPAGRTNYLLLASDNDTKTAANTDPNTQVIIFVSYDTIHNQLYVISIPRDLWVPIPGFTTDKIDTAPGYDNLSLVVKTVETNFNVTIDHYAWVGLHGFVKIIDSLGGVDIVVTHPIVENDFPDDLDPNGNPYGFRRFYIPAGPQHLDGVTSLEYVRARHADLIGDFGRSQRQQQILLQIKQKLKDADVFTLGPNLIQDMKGEFKTDLTPPELLGLAKAVLGLKANQIHRWVLTGNYTESKTLTMPNGQPNDVLLPHWDQIQALFTCVLSSKASGNCPATS